MEKTPTTFPNESPAYRRARNRLLRAEMALREQTEKVAAARRALPPGGAIPEDFLFQEAGPRGRVREVRMSGLFAPGKDTLLVYNFMYGPKMKNPCPMCTSIIDGLNIAAHHVTQRMNMVVVARSPVERIMTFARTRGWKSLRFLSSHANTYNTQYHGEREGNQFPMLNVFVRTGDAVHHAWGSEMFYAPVTAGDPRHVDALWPLWNIFDFTPDGRGERWYPDLSLP